MKYGLTEWRSYSQPLGSTKVKSVIAYGDGGERRKQLEANLIEGRTMGSGAYDINGRYHAVSPSCYRWVWIVQWDSRFFTQRIRHQLRICLEVNLTGVYASVYYHCAWAFPVGCT